MTTSPMRFVFRLAGTLCIGLSVHAAVIGVNLTPSAATLVGPPAAANTLVLGGQASSSTTWNHYTESDNNALKSDLYDQSGVRTGSSFLCSSINYASTGADTAFFTSYTFLQGSGSPGPQVSSTLKFADLTPGNTYTIVFYATWTWKDAGTTFLINGVPQTCQGVPSTATAPFTEGRSYVRFENNLADSQGEIEVTWQSYNPMDPTPEGDPAVSTDGGHRGILSAVQIEGTFPEYVPPEPPVPTGPMGTPYTWIEDQGFDTNLAAQVEIADPDLDGRLTWYEYQTGTDPNDPNDFAGTDVPEKPNIVVVMIDDAGLGDFTSYHPASLIETPTMDQLAVDGMTFQRAYSGAPYCAPSRSTLMTGYHTGHGSVRGNLGGTTLRDGDVTVAEVLKLAGYTTGGFGKWGVAAIGTPGVAHRNGFDLFYGYYHQIHAHNHYTTYIYRNGVAEDIVENVGAPSGGYVDPQYSHTQNLIFNEMKGFIQSNALAGKRFFAYGPWNPPHADFEIPSDDPAARYQGLWSHRNSEVCAAFITMVDRQVGELIELLDDPDEDGDASDSILHETLLIVMSDNGGESGSVVYDRNPGLRGSKGSVFEGGIRVPMWAHWPGVIPAGYASPRLTYFPDYMATFAELAQVTTALPDIDGTSFAGHLTGRTIPEHPPFLYFEQRSQNYGGGTYGAAIPQSVVKDWWKGYRSDTGAPLQLFNLQTDPGETVDVSAGNPLVAAELATLLDTEHVPEWPQYDPSKNKTRWEVPFGIRPEPVGFQVANPSFELPLLLPADPDDGKFLNEGATAWTGGFIQHPGNVVLAGGDPIFSGPVPDGEQVGGLNTTGNTGTYAQALKDSQGAETILYVDDLYRNWTVTLQVGRRLTGSNGPATLRVQLLGSSSGFAYFEDTIDTSGIATGTFQEIALPLPPTDIPGGYQSGNDIGQPFVLRLSNLGDGGQIFVDEVQVGSTAYTFVPPVTSRGVPHWWLETHGLGTTDLDTVQDLDPDLDGPTSAEEYVTNTDPLDGTDFLQVIPHTIDQGADILTVKWNGRSGRSYLVETRAHLDDGEWIPAYGPVVATEDSLLHAPLPLPADTDTFVRVLTNLSAD